MAGFDELYNRDEKRYQVSDNEKLGTIVGSLIAAGMTASRGNSIGEALNLALSGGSVGYTSGINALTAQKQKDKELDFDILYKQQEAAYKAENNRRQEEELKYKSAEHNDKIAERLGLQSSVRTAYGIEPSTYTQIPEQKLSASPLTLADLPPEQPKRFSPGEINEMANMRTELIPPDTLDVPELPERFSQGLLGSKYNLDNVNTELKATIPAHGLLNQRATPLTPKQKTADAVAASGNIDTMKEMIKEEIKPEKVPTMQNRAYTNAKGETILLNVNDPNAQKMINEQRLKPYSANITPQSSNFVNWGDAEKEEAYKNDILNNNKPKFGFGDRTNNLEYTRGKNQWLAQKGITAEDIINGVAAVKFRQSVPMQNSKTILSAVDPLLDELLVAGRFLDNTNLVMYNKAKNYLKEQTGSADIIGFNNLRDGVVADIERGLLNTGVLSDSKYNREINNIKASSSYPQLEAAVKNARLVIKTRLDTLDAASKLPENLTSSGNTPNRRADDKKGGETTLTMPDGSTQTFDASGKRIK